MQGLDGRASGLGDGRGHARGEAPGQDLGRGAAKREFTIERVQPQAVENIAEGRVKAVRECLEPGIKRLTR